MTLVSQIIQDAYRETNLIAINAAPTVNETAEALRILNRLFLSVIGGEAGEKLNSYTVGENNQISTVPFFSYIPENGRCAPPQARFLLNLTKPETINLMPNPLDGSRFGILDASNNLATFPLTLNGNGRNIEGLPTQAYNTNGVKREWFYRADLGSWQAVSPLLTTDPVPFPEEYDDMFICNLAMRLNSRSGTQTAPETMETYRRIKTLFKSRYSQVIEMPSELALLRTLGIIEWDHEFSGYDTSDRFNYGV